MFSPKGIFICSICHKIQTDPTNHTGTCKDCTAETMEYEEM